MRYFVGGVMQGASQANNTINTLQSQDYRKIIKDIITQADKEAEIFDPFEAPSKLLGTSDEKKLDDTQYITELFKYNLDVIKNKTDIVVAYIPVASQGTAVEMWTAYQHGVC